MTTTIEATEELASLVDRVARSTRKQFNRMDPYDLQQEAWVWLYSNRATVKEHEDNPRYLWQSVRNHLVKYSREWLAQEDGYDVEDTYYYSIPQLKALLTQCFTPDWHERGQAYDRDPGSGSSDHSDPSEAWAMVVDAKTAYRELGQKDRDLLWQALGEPGEYKIIVQQLAGSYGVTPHVLNQRVNDALSRMRRHLGGGRPRD